jgi:ADP-ribose pyrophosphatase
MAFRRIGSRTVWEGKIATVRVDRFTYDDGAEADREIVAHPGAVAIIPFDGERIIMVRQPREAVDEQALLELPAGKLDADDEEVLDTARRELAEEIGKGAGTWERLTSFYTSPGFAAEECHLYLATDLHDMEGESEEEERIEIVEVPVERLDEVIRECRDAKSVAGLLWFRAYVR